MTPAALRAAAERLTSPHEIDEGRVYVTTTLPEWWRALTAARDAARRLADVIEYAERHEHLDGVLLGDVLRIARGETGA